MGQCCGKQPPEQDHLLQDVRSESGTVKSPRFNAIAYNVMCTLCDQPISTLFETRRDSKGQPYHALCCRCSRCGRALVGESLSIREGKGFCRLHSVPERRADVVSSAPGESMVASAKLETAHVDVSELCEAMIDKIVMMPPTCTACGGTFGAKDEVRVIGMLKLHSDCVIGRPGNGRTAAVPKKAPLQMAKNALEFIAIRVSITPDSRGSIVAAPSVYTFFLSRNEGTFAEIMQMKVSAHGFGAVTVVYDAVANRHLTTTKRSVPDGVISVVDVSGNFVGGLDVIRSSGDLITSVLTRVEGGTRCDLKINIVYQRTAGILTMRPATILFEKLPDL